MGGAKKYTRLLTLPCFYANKIKSQSGTRQNFVAFKTKTQTFLKNILRQNLKTYKFFRKMLLAIHEYSLEAFQGVKLTSNMTLKTSEVGIANLQQTN